MKRRIFVIMPSDCFTDSKNKKEIIKYCAFKHGWTVNLPDYDKRNPSFDLISTLKTMSESELLLADLSNERPSCYFEVGLAEASGLNIAVLAAEGTPIHQTSFRKDVYFFNNLNEYQKIICHILCWREADLEK